MTPRASRSKIVVEDGVVRAYVTAAPVEGQANEALIELLAERLQVPKRSVEIRRGHRSRTKEVAVLGMDDAEVLQRLAIV